MKKISFLLLALFTICFVFSCSNQQPTEFNSEDGSIKAVSKKGGRVKPSGVKYSSSVLLSHDEFNVIPTYYEDETSVSCYNYDYLNKPNDVGDGEFISISVEAHSLNSKDWFNTVIVIIERDFDVNGQPDEDEEFLLLGENLDYYQKFTQTPEPVVFFWWGQWRDLNPETYECQLKICEPGRYLLRVSLRQELKNKKGNYGVHQVVYSSLDDPSFQQYDGIQQGYTPIIVK